YRYLNQPAVKQAIKNVIGISSCAFAALALYDLYMDPQACEDKHSLIARVTIIVTAALSPIALRNLSQTFSGTTVARAFASIFGQNVNFVSNPRHPRHLISIANTILGIPVITKLFYNILSRNEPTERTNCILSNSQIQWIAAGLCLTSRPALHLGNALARSVI
ncbi:MAG: hypothetical protein ACI8RA_003104, partial [Chlamydiales bacterium]